MKKLKLRNYQKTGVRRLCKYLRRSGGALLADEMGLGKTAQALNWRKKKKVSSRPTLVVCPANAKYVWERECFAWTGIKPMVLEGRYKKGLTCVLHGDIIVINYDILSSWLPALRAYRFQAILMDEAHYISNPDTARYKAINALCVREIKRGRKTFRTPLIPYRMGISGTPLTNTPANLWAILSILWPSRYVSKWSFYNTYCRPYRRRGRWIVTGAKNLKQLNAELKANGIIRRRKKDYMKELPPKIRNIIPIKVKLTEYNKASDDFIKWLHQINPRKAARAKRAETMTRIGYLLRLAARLKMCAIAEWIDEFMESTDRKLIVFSYCSPILRVLEKRYGNMAVRIDGSVRGRERMALVDRFQQDKTCRLAFCNGKAAGVALTMTAAWDILGTDFPWSPATLMQAEDRAHRFGQKNQVTANYLVAMGTMESNVVDTLASKQTIIEKILDGKADNDSKELRTLNKSILKTLIAKAMKGNYETQQH